MDLNQILSEFKNDKDVREKALSNMLDKLFDKEFILMISRLNTTLAYYIVKHLIIDRFYYNYYQKIKVKIYIKPCKYPPFYTKEIKYQTSGLNKIKETCYRNLIEELLQITISFGGKGREEIIGIIKAIESKIDEEEKRTNILPKKLM